MGIRDLEKDVENGRGWEVKLVGNWDKEVGKWKGLKELSLGN